MREYYFGMKYRRALVWSRGLRKLIGLGEELTDEELAAQTFADDKDYILTIWDWSKHVTRPESEHIAADLLVLCNLTHGNVKIISTFLGARLIPFSFNRPSLDDEIPQPVKHHKRP